jgi:hypothetical protein
MVDHVHQLVTESAMAGVPIRIKMYRTPATCEIHAVLHFVQKSKVNIVHFDEKNHISLPALVNSHFRNPTGLGA